MSYTIQGSQPYTTVSRSPDTSGNYVCSGAADDVQIQLAVDKVEADGGGVIVIKAGNYSLDDYIRLASGEVYIYGVGRGVTNLVASGALGGADPLFYLTSSGNHIERLSINMSDEGDNCIEGYGAGTNLFEDLSITNVTQDAFHFTSATEVNSNKIINCSIAQPGRYGIFFDDEVGHSWINRNVISDSTGATKTSTAGMYFGWGGQQTCTQNVIWGLEVALLIAGGVYRFQWNNNIMTGNWTDVEVNGANGMLQFNSNLHWTVGLNQGAAIGDQNSNYYFNTASGQYGVVIGDNISDGDPSARANHFIHCTTNNTLYGTMSANYCRNMIGVDYDIGTQTNLITNGDNHSN